ncbi:MAG: hypothetical protein WD229_08250 [Pirellulales bacterium]
MQRFTQLLTSVIFAAHALLGCGVHHICQHGSVVVESAAHQCSHHDGPASHRGDSHAPADNHQCPMQQCQHMACSFVKTDTVRIDHGERTISLVASLHCTAQTDAAQTHHAACDPICKANFSSVQLYVWHCALLI